MAVATLQKRMRRHRQALRFLGLLFALVGGWFTLIAVPIAADPRATIRYNGEVTTALGPKLGAALAAAGVTALGVFVVSTPARVLDKWIVWRLSLGYTYFGRRRS